MTCSPTLGDDQSAVSPAAAVNQGIGPVDRSPTVTVQRAMAWSTFVIVPRRTTSPISR